MPEELWTEVLDIVQEAWIKTIPKKNKCKKAKWLSEEALQIAEKREGKGEKERYIHLNAECQRIGTRGKKASCTEIEKNNKMIKNRYLFRKSEIPREHFWQRRAQERNGPNSSRRD